jgi:hypothetical protein
MLFEETSRQFSIRCISGLNKKSVFKGVLDPQFVLQ